MAARARACKSARGIRPANPLVQARFCAPTCCVPCACAASAHVPVASAAAEHPPRRCLVAGTTKEPPDRSERERALRRPSLERGTHARGARGAQGGRDRSGPGGVRRLGRRVPGVGRPLEPRAAREQPRPAARRRRACAARRDGAADGRPVATAFAVGEAGDVGAAAAAVTTATRVAAAPHLPAWRLMAVVQTDHPAAAVVQRAWRARARPRAQCRRAAAAAPRSAVAPAVHASAFSRVGQRAAACRSLAPIFLALVVFARMLPPGGSGSVVADTDAKQQCERPSPELSDALEDASRAAAQARDSGRRRRQARSCAGALDGRMS